MNRWAWSIAALVLAAVQVTVLYEHFLPFVEDRYFILNKNSVRDFVAYVDVSRGVYPLHGPSTSVGGSHGYLGYYLYGLALKAWGIASWYPVQLVLFGLSGLLSAQLLRNVTGRPLGTLAWPVLLASGMPFLLFFPNHITGIMPASLLAFVVLTSGRGGPVMALLLGTAIAAHMGVHRTGYLLLAYLFLMRRRLHVAWLRSPAFWLPLALYHVLPVWVWWLGQPPAPSSVDLLGHYFVKVNPLDVALFLPFIDLDVAPSRWLLFVELGLVVATLRRLRPKVPPLGTDEYLSPMALLWWYYVLSFAIYLFVVPDQQYYMSLIGLLPALLVSAWSGLEAGRRRIMGLAMAGLCLAGTFRNAQLPSLFAEHHEHTQFYSLPAMKPVLDRFAAEGVPTDTLWQRTLAPEGVWTPSYWSVYHLYHQIHGPESEVCVRFPADGGAPVQEDEAACDVLEEIHFLFGWYWIPGQGAVRR